MDLEIPLKTAFMGIAAINIDGNTMNSFLDVPLEMNKGTGTSKRIKPCNTDRLQAGIQTKIRYRSAFRNYYRRNFNGQTLDVDLPRRTAQGIKASIR